MRKRFALEIILIAALAGTSLPATAKLREQQIFPPESFSEPGELIHLSNGGYLLTAGIAELSPTNEWQRRNVVLRMDDSLRVTGELDVPPRFTAVRPFGDHYVGQLFKDYQHRHLAVFDAGGNIVRTLYENDERIFDLYFVTAENGNAVYVLEKFFNYRFRLHRFTADGTHEWQQEFTNQDAHKLVATGDGVALYLQPYSPRPPIPPNTIMAISASGRPLWNAALPHDPHVPATPHCCNEG
jgi:hypothetical protein